MEGISKEKLIEIIKHAPSLDISELIDECKELTPWKPIETAPKYGYIKIWDKGYGQVVVNWNEYYKCFTDAHGHKYLQPAHWQELPEPPNL